MRLPDACAQPVLFAFATCEYTKVTFAENIELLFELLSKIRLKLSLGITMEHVDDGIWPENVRMQKDEHDQVHQRGMAVVLRVLQAKVAQLTEASATQTAAFESLKEDIFLNSADAAEEEGEQNGSQPAALLNLNDTVNALLATPDSADTNTKGTDGNNSAGAPDSGSQNEFLDSLTQAFIPTIKKSPAIETKLAELINNMLSGELSPDTVQERVEKYPAPENCEYLIVTSVNEEIWDLMAQDTRTVDLAVQKTQGLLIQGLSAMTILAGNLVSCSNPERTDTRNTTYLGSNNGQCCHFLP